MCIVDIGTLHIRFICRHDMQNNCSASCPTHTCSIPWTEMLSKRRTYQLQLNGCWWGRWADGDAIHCRPTNECIINRNRLISFIVYLCTVDSGMSRYNEKQRQIYCVIELLMARAYTKSIIHLGPFFAKWLSWTNILDSAKKCQLCAK